MSTQRAVTAVAGPVAPVVPPVPPMHDITSKVPATPEEGVEAAIEHVRIAMIGNVDAGKSTLVGCLTKGTHDDGRGSARASVFRHAHEAANGRTASVGMEVLGFKGDDAITFGAKTRRADAWREITRTATKSVSMIDLCGHERYLRTTVFGLTGLVPDYGLVVVGANMGVSRMTKEHVGIAAALKIPLVVVVTKVDIAPEKVYKTTMQQVARMLKAARKHPYLVRKFEDVDTAVDAVAGERITPVIRVSNVTGEGLDTLREIIRRLPSRGLAEAADVEADRAASKRAVAGAATAGMPVKFPFPKIPGIGGGMPGMAPTAGAGVDTTEAAADETKADTTPAAAAATVADTRKGGEAMIDSVFNVPGTGTVVAGLVTGGIIRTGETMMLGPDRAGKFNPVTVRSIHIHFSPAEVAIPGRSAAFNIRPIGKEARAAKAQGVRGRSKWVRKGMHLVHPSRNPAAHREFEAEVLILHHQTTLKTGYSPTIHCGVVQQAARVVGMRKPDGSAIDALRTGDRAVLQFRFEYRPEYLKPGTMMLLRDGRAKGVGRVKTVGPTGAKTKAPKAAAAKATAAKAPVEGLASAAGTATAAGGTPAAKSTGKSASRRRRDARRQARAKGAKAAVAAKATATK